MSDRDGTEPRTKKKQYAKPVVESERIFETLALGCLKKAPQTGCIGGGNKLS